MDAIISAGAHLQSFGYGQDTDFKRLAFLGVLLSWAIKTGAALYKGSRSRTPIVMPAAADETLSTRETWMKAQDWEEKKTWFTVPRQTYQLLTASVTAAGAASLLWKASFHVLAKINGSPESQTVLSALMFTAIRDNANIVMDLPLTIWGGHLTSTGKPSAGLVSQALQVIPTSEAMRWIMGYPVLQMVGKIASPLSTTSICAVVIAANFIYQTIWPIVIQPSLLKLNALEEGDLRKRVVELARKEGFPLHDVLVLQETFPATELNPYYSGMPWARTIIFYDTLMMKAEPVEIEALVARQIYLWKHALSIYQIALDQLEFTIHVIAMLHFLPDPHFFAAFGLPTSLARNTILACCVGSDLVDCVRAPFDIGMALAGASLQKEMTLGADRFAASLGYKKSLSSVILKLKRRQLTKRETLDPLALGWKPNASLEDRLRAIEAC